MIFDGYNPGFKDFIEINKKFQTVYSYNSNSTDPSFCLISRYEDYNDIVEDLGDIIKGSSFYLVKPKPGS